MIAIKNAEMPRSCTQCWFNKGVYCIYHDSDWVGDHQANQTKPEWCPINEIIQCKNCKWFAGYAEIKGRGTGYCTKLKPAGDGQFICWDDWYCGDGERKDG